MLYKLIAYLALAIAAHVTAHSVPPPECNPCPLAF